MTTEPDMIQQAGQLLRKAQSGEPIATFPETDALQATVDTAIVIASAVLAIAGELRELRNLLAMAMSEGSDMNGEPISFLRIDTGA